MDLIKKYEKDKKDYVLLFLYKYAYERFCNACMDGQANQEAHKTCKNSCLCDSSDIDIDDTNINPKSS